MSSEPGSPNRQSAAAVGTGTAPTDLTGTSAGNTGAAGVKWREYFTALSAAFGNLVMGTTISWSGPVLPLLQLPPQQDGFDLSDSNASWIGSLMPLGALFGGQVAGFIIQRLGRKGTMLACSLVFVVSYLVILVAPYLWLVFVGRFLTGIGTGIASMVGPVYVAEVASVQNRGLLGSCVQVMVTIGVVISILLGLTNSWRWITLGCLLTAVIWFCLLLFISPSPADYIRQNRFTDALETLMWIRGTSDVEAEFQELHNSQTGSDSSESPWRLLGRKENLVPLGLSLGLMFGQQLSGMNAVLFYVVDIFTAAGSSLSPITESIIIGVVQVGATVLAALFMDKLGRRLLLGFSALVMTVSMTALGAYFYVKINLGREDLATKMELLPVASVSTFVIAFSVGFGPIPWLMMSELIGPEVKSQASSIATSFNWSLAFLVTKYFSGLELALTEAGSFWLFAGILAAVFMFCLLFIPETKGEGVESIQAMFRSDTPYYYNIGLWKCCCSSQGAAGDLEQLIAEGDPSAT